MSGQVNSFLSLARQLDDDTRPLTSRPEVPCYYKCIFGISRPIAALTKGAHYVMNHYYSYLIITGPGERVYWFLLVKLDVPLFGNDIPRYSKSDEEALARQHASDPITPSVTFGQLYEARTSSVLTPLHEYVFEKWHFERVITIGDAAHKVRHTSPWSSLRSSLGLTAD